MPDDAECSPHFDGPGPWRRQVTETDVRLSLADGGEYSWMLKDGTLTFDATTTQLRRPIIVVDHHALDQIIGDHRALLGPRSPGEVRS